MIILKKIHLQKREYVMIFMCIGLLLIIPIVGMMHQSSENIIGNYHYVWFFIMVPIFILVGIGWIMPLMFILAFFINMDNETLGDISSSLDLSNFHFLPLLILPLVSTVLIIKFSTGIPPWRAILYAHIIASGIGMVGIVFFYPSILS